MPENEDREFKCVVCEEVYKWDVEKQRYIDDQGEEHYEDVEQFTDQEHLFHLDGHVTVCLGCAEMSEQVSTAVIRYREYKFKIVFNGKLWMNVGSWDDTYEDLGAHYDEHDLGAEVYDKAFKLAETIVKATRWSMIDGWRGYNDTKNKAELYEFDQQTILVWISSKEASMRGVKTEREIKRIFDGIEETLLDTEIIYACVFHCTSNVFSTLTSHFVLKEDEERLKEVIGQ